MKRESKGTPTLLSEAILKLMKSGNTDWQKPWRNKDSLLVKDTTYLVVIW